LVDEGVPPDKLELNTKNAIFQDHDSEEKFKTLKGLCHQLNIFLDAHAIKSVLSVHAQMVFKFLACLVQEKNYFEVFDSFFEKSHYF
jgi:hypothetical protein